MNVHELPAGPELDRLVAEKVMGWTIKRHYQPEGVIFHAREEDAIFVNGEMKWWASAWQPSINIAHAWEVVERIKSPRPDGFCFSISFDGQWVVAYEEYGSAPWWVRADTAPLAICRAALKVVA